MAIAIVWRLPYNRDTSPSQGESRSVPRKSDARKKAIETAERLFRVQGYAATGLTQIIDDSKSPKGSFYFHFPEGKLELAAEVLAAYRESTTKGFRSIAERTAGDPNKFVRALTNAVAREMEASGWTAGCVAQTLAQELAPGDKKISAALAGLFDDWVTIIASACAVAGTPDRAARQRALALIASHAGARPLARTQRSLDTVETA